MGIVIILIIVFMFIFSLAQQKKRQDGAGKKLSHEDGLDTSTITIQEQDIRGYIYKTTDIEPIIDRAPISTSDYSSRQKSSIFPDYVWIPKGKPVTVAGYTISGGLLYVGHGLYYARGRGIGWDIEPALIDPSLPVEKDSFDKDGMHMSYWPSYSQIHPASRNAYLQWLADGCKDPSINISYVFLYFYGLERRALSDAENSSAAKEELEVILTEIKRLRTIYNTSSFLNYTAGFISAVESRRTKDKLYKNSPSFEGKGYELPFGLKKGLAQLAADGIPLPPDWALAWVENDPESRLRTPAYRCKEEFRKLFHVRYREKFGEGLMLLQKGSKLRGSYRPASASFGGAVEWVEEGLLDVAAYRGPINQMLKIAEACVSELDPYSRYLGRSGNDPSPLAKLALFPAPLLKDYQDDELQALKQWLSKNIVSDQMFVTDIQSIVRHFPLLKPESFNKRDFMALCQLLAKIGVGIEPDVRFDGSLPESGPVVLFRSPTESANSPTPEYASATTILHLAAAVAGSDGKVSEEEERLLEEQLKNRFQLSSDERVRLRAHTRWIFSSSLNFSGVKKRLESFNQTQRQTLGRFLVSVAQVDGYIDSSEVKILNKIYGLIGLDSKELYSHVHIAATEPVKIEDAETQGPSYAVPKPAHRKKFVSVELDMNKVDVKLAETAAVTAMLSNIFNEEKTLSPIVEKTIIEVAGNFKHFESEYHGFIKELSQKLSWAREEIEALAAKNDLLLDGVLDSINDAAFTAFDQPFFEGDDPIEINPNVLKELQT
ncbi:MAG: TerB N-terminal domain-containing protein [Candidatus Omnitrophica bacterium]|nr:TerB N-terminal domain-containing protein [Candidatus Omnitrophota bacterium]